MFLPHPTPACAAPQCYALTDESVAKLRGCTPEMASYVARNVVSCSPKQRWLQQRAAMQVRARSQDIGRVRRPRPGVQRPPPRGAAAPSSAGCGSGRPCRQVQRGLGLHTAGAGSLAPWVSMRGGRGRGGASCLAVGRQRTQQ